MDPCLLRFKYDSVSLVQTAMRGSSSSRTCVVQDERAVSQREQEQSLKARTRGKRVDGAKQRYDDDPELSHTHKEKQPARLLDAAAAASFPNKPRGRDAYQKKGS